MKDEINADFRRLPTSVTPIHYEITLRPDLKKFTFSGSAAIRVRVNEETKRLVLNALDIDISVVSFASDKGKTINTEQIVMDVKTETVCLEFAEPLTPGSGMLTIAYTGCLNDRMKGFYRSKYTSTAGADGPEERYGAATHFEPTGARMAFPCWDEPALKATFDITLVVPANRVALSNTNAISESALEEDPTLRRVKFATTPLMSTYLVAFVVGEYDYVEDRTREGVRVRVYTPAGKSAQGVFALDVAVKCLHYYNDYFGIEYVLPKLDLIAIADFAIGAMENWGLVTYKERCLLVDAGNTSAAVKQFVAIIITHELSHQWFGNLVTMEWWTDLWLKEGFATFMSYLCVDHLFPEYEIWSQFVADDYIPALELDALHNSHPIEVRVGHPAEISEIFDAISYDKGSSVIRMLYQFIGDGLFRKGLNAYLTRNSYKNTETEDLWTALQESSNKPVRDVMSTWTKQKGFPVLSISSRNDGSDRILSLTQEKFCADGSVPASEADVLWLIPVSISKGSNGGEIALEVLMESKTMEICVPNVATDEWLKVNPKCVGVYRVQYSPEMLSLLLPAVESKALPPLDRLGLQNDMFALVLSGRSSTVDALKLMDAFINEDNYSVWNSICGCLERLQQLLSQTSVQPLFQDFGRQLLSKVHSRLGWEPTKGETHSNALLRSLIIIRLVAFEDQSVLTQSKQFFDSHSSGTHVIAPDLRSAVYRAVAVECDDRAFEALFRLYRESDLNEEKIRLASALGCVKDRDHIKRVLEFALSPEVRTQDSLSIIISVAHTKNGRQMAWDFFKQNYDELRRRYEGMAFAPCALVKNISENFATEEMAQQIQTFFTEKPFSGTERTVQQSLETVRLNVQWLSRDLSSIQSYLSNRF